MTQNKINSTSLTFRNNVVIKQLKRLTIFAAGPIGRAVEGVGLRPLAY
jgi:hypothetical protein